MTDAPQHRHGPRLLVLWVPDWPVLAHARADGIRESAPIVLIEKGLVVACSAAARVEGVRRGMRQREAQARCPDVVVRRYDPALDARAFEPVLAVLTESLPDWHAVRPGTAAVRARGPARYYGGERAAAMTVRGIVADLGGAHARIGIADGLFAAEHAARFFSPEILPESASKPAKSPPSAQNLRRNGITIVEAGRAGEFLAPIPVGVLAEPELVALLPRLGIRTLGEFAALDVADVAARFGPMGARMHALASGRDPRPATPRIPPRDLDAVVDFEPALERVDQVAFGVRAAADDLVTGLLAERLVCTALRVQLEGEEGDVSDRVWLHPRSFVAAEVVDRVRWQLEGARDGAVATIRSAVVRVRISPESVDPVGAHERGLWGTGPDDGVHSGLSRVQGMLGHEGVLTATASGGRTPSDRRALVPWGDRPLVARELRSPWPGALPAPAPATVYAIPRPIVVQDVRGKPVAVDERGRLSGAPAVLVAPTGARRELSAWAGPWPLEERWWDAAAARRQQRFQVVDTTGSAWLVVLDEDGWWAEGRYD